MGGNGEAGDLVDLVEEFSERARAAGYKMTPQRMELVEELAQTKDHPTADDLLHRIREKNPRYTMASVYRTLNMLEKLGLIVRHNFNEGSTRIEAITEKRHNHLIDVENGDIVEFTGQRIEKLQRELAEKLGYELLDYKLEIYARPLGGDPFTRDAPGKFTKRKHVRF